MNFGETLIIAGLISNQVTSTTSKIPFFGELPWIGAAFRRVLHNEAETELIVLVTPELVSPVDASQLPDGPGRSTTSPTDRELYWNGYLEVPKYAPTPEPPTTNFGFPADYSPPPAMLVPGNKNGAAPKPGYEGDSAKSSAVPTDLPAPPAARGNGNDGAKAAPPAPGPAPEGDEGPNLDETSRARYKRSLADPATRRITASRKPAADANTIRPLQPNRAVNRSGTIVPASGSRPTASRTGDDGSAPGLISPQ
jgi:pilus assembly protein CpaC